MLHVALYQPAIPQNTGNIGRLCVGMGAHLHIIQPTVFELSDKTVRRAGLDYWPDLTLTLHDDTEAFLGWLGDKKPWLITKLGRIRFDKVTFRDEDVLILGNENTGLPENWHARWQDRRVFVPIQGPIRSYNLANTAAIVLAQGMLQLGDSENTT
jgi:tRNA (cytidine/uridine-2'-O-)-methyltransferase